MRAAAWRLTDNTSVSAAFKQPEWPWAVVQFALWDIAKDFIESRGSVLAGHSRHWSGCLCRPSKHCWAKDSCGSPRKHEAAPREPGVTKRITAFFCSLSIAAALHSCFSSVLFTVSSTEFTWFCFQIAFCQWILWFPTSLCSCAYHGKLLDTEIH